jgi:hypothetical protein
MVCGVLALIGKRERLKPLFFMLDTFDAPPSPQQVRAAAQPGKSEKRLTFGGEFRPCSWPTAFVGEDTATVLMKTQPLG